jgi:hypothetical protein
LFFTSPGSTRDSNLNDQGTCGGTAGLAASSQEVPDKRARKSDRRKCMTTNTPTSARAFTTFFAHEEMKPN